MKREYGYTTTVLIGHSRGSIVTCKWIASGSKETQDVEAFVNVSGRFRMEVCSVTCTLLMSRSDPFAEISMYVRSLDK